MDLQYIHYIWGPDRDVFRELEQELGKDFPVMISSEKRFLFALKAIFNADKTKFVIQSLQAQAQGTAYSRLREHSSESQQSSSRDLC
jgi:hypothetical protein